ncbi:MAG: PASTA domain-containing protein [Phycisphaerae bacterium]|nr:PASTA domain-containing protein [Phycisphaerae bacterium]MDD5381614.1 PASTA domain-containing protein [Phycisphaerae bacterium]
MRKFVLLFFVALFMTVPAMAASTVDITCTEAVIGDVNWVTVSYTSDINRIRAFGLDINVPGGSIIDVCDINPNYRIYPGQISIVDGDVNDYYTPYDACDLADHNNVITLEMGSLYTTDSNYELTPNAGYNMIPGLSGTLLKFAYQDANCYIIDVNALRGGIVMEDPNEAPSLDSPLYATDCGGLCTMPNLIGEDKDDVDAILAAAGFPAGNGTGVNSCETLDEVLSQDQTAGTEIDCATVVNYTYSLYQTVVPDVIGMTQAAAEAAITAAGLTVGTITEGDGGATTIGNVYAQSPTDGGTVVACGTTVDISVAAYCMKSTHPDYAKWVAQGRPKCWCYSKQCRGDMSGAKEGVFWVSNTDKDIMVLYLNKYPNAPAPFAGACADLNHTKTGLFWVENTDKALMLPYFNKPAIPPDCDATYINFWCTPGSTGLGCP